MSFTWYGISIEDHIQPLSGRGYRLVENQEEIASTEIVTTLEEQAILEEMLETLSKPKLRSGTESLNYLLSTPFRYPPLQNGSRFGTKQEPSLFYGGTTVDVTLCEGAYYRFFFYHDMEDPPIDGALKSQHTLFDFSYQTGAGIKLQGSPFDSHRIILRDPANYTETQALGSGMRETEIKAFEYISARDTNMGINIALYDETPLTCIGPINTSACLCQTEIDKVTYSIDGKIASFSIRQFQVHGILPNPSY